MRNDGKAAHIVAQVPQSYAAVCLPGQGTPATGRDRCSHFMDSVWNALMGGRSAVHLLGEVILQTHLFDQIKLSFEKVDVFFFVFQENLEEIG